PVPMPANPAVEQPLPPPAEPDPVIDEVGSMAPLPQAISPQEPHGPVVPAGGAFIGDTGTVEDDRPEADELLANYVAGTGATGGGLNGMSVTLLVADLDRSLAFYRDA